MLRPCKGILLPQSSLHQTHNTMLIQNEMSDRRKKNISSYSLFHFKIIYSGKSKMYITQYFSFCLLFKYPQNDYELPCTYPEMSPLRDESKHTFPNTPALWLQGTSVTADFLDFSISVTDHHTALKTGCRGFCDIILWRRYSEGWSRSVITGDLLNTPPKCSVSYKCQHQIGYGGPRYSCRLFNTLYAIHEKDMLLQNI